ncbi:ABC transporter ATP-binding protein [Halobacillus salinarum]|uniref:ABC transporter ATP-binding protein n=1 Tax=Halobacillus salinarum TaxID=2932257 RepID=A0ABY4EJT3_9BACI|nr:ABC transporter ATP-binding protein [Halobacillus salinarum]UOQ44307.1 ABC transporter ATP-binding protein [Halobacillus salinarum]
MIEARQLTNKIGGKTVVDEFSHCFETGKVTTIIGPNGAGKSTILKSLAGIYPLKKHTVYIEDRDILSCSLKERAQLIGIVPQLTSITFPMTVMDYALLGRRPHLTWGVREQDLKIVNKILNSLEISDLSNSYLDEISGGEKQKASIARVLAQETSIVMMDEPISALDIRYQFEVLNLAKSLAKQEGYTVILVLHDLELAARFSDSIILVDNGKKLIAGPPEAVITKETMKRVYGVNAAIHSELHGIRISVLGPA